MNLISTARALDDQMFRWRVQAASLVKASKFAEIPAGPGQNYAFYTLLNPQAVDVSLVALVALDEAIASAIDVGPDGGVKTDKVLDADIVRAVDSNWDTVAVKYPTNPLGGA